MVSDKEIRQLKLNTELIGFILIDLYKKTDNWDKLSENKKKQIIQIANQIWE